MTFKKRTHQLMGPQFVRLADYLITFQLSENDVPKRSPISVKEVKRKLKAIHEKYELPMQYDSGSWRLSWENNAETLIDANVVMDALEYLLCNITACMHNQKQIERDLYPIVQDLVETFSEQLQHETKTLSHSDARRYMNNQFQQYARMTFDEQIESKKLEMAANRCVKNYSGLFDGLPYCMATPLISAYAHVKEMQWANRQKKAGISSDH